MTPAVATERRACVSTLQAAYKLRASTDNHGRSERRFDTAALVVGVGKGERRAGYSGLFRPNAFTSGTLTRLPSASKRKDRALSRSQHARSSSDAGDWVSPSIASPDR